MLFLANKRLNNKTLENIEFYDKYSKTYSFNRQTTFKNGQTKYLIVGTITPKKGRDNGYFYCSNKNKQYDLIDAAFNDAKSLADTKNELIKTPKSGAKINKIKEILVQRKMDYPRHQKQNGFLSNYFLRRLQIIKHVLRWFC